MGKKSEWDIQCELNERTIDALLLGFLEPLKFDYPLPCSYEVSTFAMKATREICGAANPRIWNGSSNIILSELDNPEKLELRVRDGLVGAINSYKDENSYLDLYMSMSGRFGSEWFYGLGSLYRFRPGEREESEQRVRNYWNEIELDNFKELNKIIQGLTQKEYKKKKDR